MEGNGCKKSRRLSDERLMLSSPAMQPLSPLSRRSGFFWGVFFRWCLYLACHLWPGLMRRVAGVRSRLSARLTLKEKIEKGEECKLSLGAGSAALCLFKR